MIIGDRIKEQRLSKKWTQEYLANLLNVSRPTVSSWEVGRNYPDLETILIISDIFEISLDQLLREDTKMVKETTIKTRRFVIYKWGAVVLGLLLIAYIGYNQKLRHDEQSYRYNLNTEGWQLARNPQADGNAYEKTEGAVKYSTYIMPAESIGIPLKEQKVNVIAVNKNLVVSIDDKNKFMAIISKDRDKKIDFSVQTEIDKNGYLVRFEKNESKVNQDKAKKYLAEHRKDYKELIHSGINKREQIVNGTKK